MEADSHVRPYRPVDATTLAVIHNLVYGPDAVRPGSLQRRLAKSLERGGRAWVIILKDKPAGYAFVDPVPGLNNIYHLQGCITPAWRRQGLGSQLLLHLLGDLQADLESGIESRVEHAVESLDSPAGRFLTKNGFFTGHEEWHMVLPGLDHLPMTKLPPGYQIRTLAQEPAIRTFLELYEKAFGGLPWYQPYLGEGEVAAELEDPADLLFLFDGLKPAGLLWMRWPSMNDAEIEPVGILPEYRGRGLGRTLLLAGLDQLAGQGARRVAIGVWRENRPAITLYQSLGFRRYYTLTYLVYTVKRL